jgi:hypothetical protein
MCAKIPENTSLVDKEKFDATFQLLPGLLFFVFNQNLCFIDVV